jgi:outer membrane protein assembly factor BamD (BamD/ComL family)
MYGDVVPSAREAEEVEELYQDGSTTRQSGKYEPAEELYQEAASPSPAAARAYQQHNEEEEEGEMYQVLL